VVAATVLVSGARPVRRWTGCAWLVAVVIAACGFVAILGAIGFLIRPQLQAQVRELVDTVPDVIRSIEGRLNVSIDREDFARLLQSVAARVTSWSAAVAGAITSLVLVLVTGGFLAAAPERYRDGAVRLFPPPARDRLRLALDKAGHGLRAWLVAQLAAMAIVGTCVAAGTWALGLPSPLALGVVAALAEFVPVIGPVAAAVPALLLALGMGWGTLAWTAVLYVAIQQVESNMILPLLEQGIARVPPALLILAFAAFGTLFGVAGVILSTPLTVVMLALVRALYVEPMEG
jgi:predicted PurR-regulated permease PerM